MPDYGTSVSLIGYHLSFDAEMSDPSDMAKFSNVFSNGDHTLWMNHEAEYYVDYSATDPDNPFLFDNGALDITASPVSSGAGLPYTSGLIQTADTFSQNQGYFEIRAELPSNQGFWPAFWQLPAGQFYPEADIMEQPNDSGSTSEYWTRTNTPTDDSGGFYDTGVDLSAGYHTYGFMWTGDYIQYVFDGKYFGSPHDTPPALAASQMYLLANLAVGGPGSWPGPPVPDDSATLKIDYIRAFSNDPNVPGVAQQPISSPDGVDTTPVVLPPAISNPPPIGSGPDSLTLQVAENALQGIDAQFLISVDGVQQDGVQTAQANDAFAQTQTFTVKGTFAFGLHDVAIDFLNDGYVAGVGDRNLFIKAAAVDGAALPGLPLDEYSGGAQDFSFGEATLSIGSGADTLALSISEDAWQGDAQYTIAIDGTTIGGVRTAVASHAAGATQDLSVHGDWGTGPHTIGVTFLNDAYGGDPTSDRNLYVDAATFDGQAVDGAPAALLSDGTTTLPIPAALGTTTLTLHLAEDAWRGDAQYAVSVDGVPLGQGGTATASNAEGQSQTVTLYDTLSAGTHDLAVSFLNDLYGGTASTDRNLYVNGIDVDGVPTGIATGSLMTTGTLHFQIVIPTS